MKTWIKRTLIGAVSATVLLGSLAAWSQSTPGWHHGQVMSAQDMAQMRAKMLDRVSTELALDANQKALLSTLADQLHAQRMGLMGAGAAGTAASADPRAAMKARLDALVAGNSFDRAGAQAMVDEKVAQLRTQSPALISAAGDFFDSLRPDQQQKVRDFLNRDHHGWMHRSGKTS